MRIHHAVRWYYRMGRRVWFREIWRFLTQDRARPSGFSVRQIAGEAQDHEEEASAPFVRRAG